ncbi:MAG: NAD(P)/FAD-dependent oxidoreductase [Actinomycetota bacterium]|nr:NAD(P)/FAD-dependent oxidoreductase [Actinomycetota bacterium]
MTSAPDAVVVGSGPNGLAAAVTLAGAGLSVTVLERSASIGGGTRTEELTVPGVLHDVCSAVHPLAVASPFLSSLDLGRHGLRWMWPEVDVAHPLDSGRAAVMAGSLAETAAGLGAAGSTWRRLFGPLVERFQQLAVETMGPVLHVPRHPLTLSRFGVRAILPATAVTSLLRAEEPAALFAGIAAHVNYPLERPATAAPGLLLAATGQWRGWPVAKGGSARIAGALASLLASLGGRLETGVHVAGLAELEAWGRPRVVMLDTSPPAAARICGDRMPAAVRHAYESWRFGAAAFKLDLAVSGGLPWTAEPCRRAGTVHVGGAAAEIAAAERDVHRGRMPSRPFVLVAQQYISDPSRSSGDVHPVWAYAHAPQGYDGDATGAILGQIERFAPGSRDRIVALAAQGPAETEAYNPNYVGGDIATGANDWPQLLFRPRLTAHPYDTGVPGVYLCSAATPPGAGVHGMCGHLAARRALDRLHVR